MDRKQKQKVEGEKLISRGEMRSLVHRLARRNSMR